MNALHPTDEQVAAFYAANPDGQPVFMLNLLKFKAQSTYREGEQVSGKAAYDRYARAFGQMLKDLDIEGVETTFGGDVTSVLIGDADYDAVALVRYPDAKTMFRTVSSESYRSFHYHRAAGLEGQLLIACNGSGVF